jgi:ABC-type glycerol-3-phosphate transport system substrate-binding protein
MNGFQVSSDCAHPEAAWRWVKHLISREWMLEYMIRTGRTPSRQALLREIPRTLVYHPKHLQEVANAVLNPTSTSQYLSPILRRFGDDSSGIIMPALRGEKSVNTVLEELDARASALFSELK